MRINNPHQPINARLLITIELKTSQNYLTLSSSPPPQYDIICQLHLYISHTPAGPANPSWTEETHVPHRCSAKWDSTVEGNPLIQYQLGRAV